MKILLIYPPWRQPFMPPLSITALSGYLEAQGVRCVQRDLNLETFDRLLTPSWIERSGGELVRRIEEIEQEDQVDGETALVHESLVGALLRLPALTRLTGEARETLHDPDRFFLLGEYRQAMRIIEEVLGVISLAWSPCRFMLHGHRSAAGDTCPDGPAKQMAGGSEERLISTIIEETFLPSITGETPGLLLVQADYRSQLLSALTLLRQIKQQLPEVRTAMAGWMAEELLVRPHSGEDLSCLIDVLVSGRPEEPLLRMSRALESGRFDHLSGLVRRGPGEPPMVVAEGLLPQEELPAPSFTGLKLNRYLSPEPVLPVRASSSAAEQIIAAGARHQCRRFLLTGSLDRAMVNHLADGLTREPEAKAWFGSLSRDEQLDQSLCRRMAESGCTKLQLRIGPDPPAAGQDLLDQSRQAIQLCPPAGIGIHLHCRLDEEDRGKEVVEPMSRFLAGSCQELTSPGTSFSCRVIRDGRLGPATGGSPPDLYNDATAPVPGAAPGFGRDPGDGDLPPETPGEEQRWRLVREAGAALGSCLTPGTAVHDFLYLARYAGNPPVPRGPTDSSSPLAPEPGQALRPAVGLTRGLFQTYDPTVPLNNKDASGRIRFAAAGPGWRVTAGDGYRCRPLTDLAMKILDQCDGVRTWEEALEAVPDTPHHDLARRLVRMMFREGLLVRA